MFKKTSILIVGIIFHSNAQALPLLAENAAQSQGEILTLYPDHEDSTKFYFMPNSSRFADSAGLPSFALVHWGLRPQSAEAGGYLAFTMRLKSDADQASALKHFLNDRPGSEVAVLPVQSSTINLSTDAESGRPLSRLFDEFNFSRKGGRAEDEVGVTALLTGLGAKVFRAAIETPLMFKVDYCYSVTGLGPDLDATIRVDMKRVYEHFKSSSSAGNLWIRADIDLEVKKLTQSGAVNIQVNGGDATDEEYVQTVADKMVARLFQPGLAASSSVSEPKTGWSFSRFRVSNTQVEELKEETWRYHRRDLVDREFCVPLSLREIAPFRDSVVKDADAVRFAIGSLQ